MTNMKCPCCKEELIVTHQDHYESVVSSSYQDGYQCVNEYCVANNLGAVWIDDGDLYLCNVPDEIKYTIASSIISKFSDNENTYAIDSWNWAYANMKNAEKKSKRTLKIGKYVIHMYNSYSTDYKTFKYSRKFMPRFEYYKISLDDPNCYTMLIPTPRMVKYNINQFNLCYAGAITGNKANLKTCINEMLGIDFSGKVSTQWYNRISSFIIRIFYYKKSKTIINLMQSTQLK